MPTKTNTCSCFRFWMGFRRSTTAQSSYPSQSQSSGIKIKLCPYNEFDKQCPYNEYEKVVRNKMSSMRRREKIEEKSVQAFWQQGAKKRHRKRHQDRLIIMRWHQDYQKIASISKFEGLKVISRSRKTSPGWQIKLHQFAKIKWCKIKFYAEEKAFFFKLLIIDEDNDDGVFDGQYWRLFVSCWSDQRKL